MKKFAVVVFLVLCLGSVSAHDFYYKERFLETRYFPEDDVVFSRTTWVDYDNEDRFSTYDYRHGYSYRETRDYFEDRHSYDDLDFVRFEDFDRDEYRSRDYDLWCDYDYHVYRDEGVRGVRYEYVPYLGEYEARECYLSAPSDKLFYVKC